MRGRLTILLCCAASLLAQGPITFQYFYDDTGQLIKAVDSTGVVIGYVYDAVGNMLQVNRSAVAPGALSVFNFTPQQGGPLTQIMIQGQGFSTSLSANIVRFNGVQTTVNSATPSTLLVTVPLGATSGPISVTVGVTTASSGGAFTVIPSATVLSITPKYTLPGMTAASVAVSGINLTGATFSFSPQPGLTIGSVSIGAGGTSAIMSVTAGANSVGTYALVATNASGSSSAFPDSSNSFRVLNPQGDEDLDGLTNAQEVALGTDPFNPDTDGDGFPDGVEVQAGSDPKNPLSTPLTVSPVLEAISVMSSILDRADPSQASAPDSAVAIRESLGSAFALLNTADSSLGTDPAVTIREAVGPQVALQNTVTGTSSGPTTSALSGAPTLPTSPVSATSFRVWLTTPMESDTLLEGQTITVKATSSLDARLEISVNGVPFEARSEMLFTVPYGVDKLLFEASAVDSAGTHVRSEGITVSVARDDKTAIRGTVVNSSGEPVAGATVVLETAGLVGEYFASKAPLTSLPDLDGRTADVVKTVSAINVRNPDQIFGRDPIGTGIESDYASRYRGDLYVPLSGQYTFTLGVREGARLSLGSVTVISSPRGRGLLEEHSGTVWLEQGWTPVEILHYQSLGFGELQLSWAPPAGERQVISTDFLRTAEASVKTDARGAFLFSNVPAALGRAAVSVETTEPREFRLAVGTPTELGTILLRRSDR
jgi:YD repeat-containing protein